jgi:hypothetical protein
MITPKIKKFQCLEHDPIELWRPETGEVIQYQLVVFIGTKDDDASDMWYIDIVCGVNGFTRGKSLILNQYNWDSVVNHLAERVRLCAAETYDDVIAKLQVIMDWEFENYQP